MMQPYQETAEHNRNYGQSATDLLKYAGAAAAGTLGARAASTLISKISPLLNPKVPESFAKKALEKVDPRLGKFSKVAAEMGATWVETRDFIQNKIDSSEPAKQNGNIIQQYSPNLFQYMKELIGKGSSPIEAAAKARKFLDKKQQDIIAKMEKDHKTDWSSIVQTVFGGEGMAPEQQQQGQPQQEQPQQQQGGQGLDPGVAQILQQGNEIMKRFRGQ
jgi:hypothetical protein